MEKISDEFLEYKIALLQKSGCEAISINSDVLLPILQELKERRSADKLFDIKAQLRLVRDKCPDVWEDFYENYLSGICPSEYGLKCEEDDSSDGTDCSGYSSQCKLCWNKALDGVIE